MHQIFVFFTKSTANTTAVRDVHILRQIKNEFFVSQAEFHHQSLNTPSTVTRVLVSKTYFLLRRCLFLPLFYMDLVV